MKQILLFCSNHWDFISTVKSDRLLGNRKVICCKLPVGVLPDGPNAGRNLQVSLENLNVTCRLHNLLLLHCNNTNKVWVIWMKNICFIFLIFALSFGIFFTKCLSEQMKNLFGNLLKLCYFWSWMSLQRTLQSYLNKQKNRKLVKVSKISVGCNKQSEVQ